MSAKTITTDETLAISVDVQNAGKRAGDEVVQLYVSDIAAQPNVGICVDTGDANISGLKSSEMILEAGDLLIETHFNDNFGWLCEENAINDIHCPPGIGTVDWLQVVDALDRIGHEKPIIFEVGSRGKNEELDDFLRLTRDNWRLIIQAWQYVKEGLAKI